MIAVLCLLLPAGTEPTASAMTSAGRAIEIPDRPHRPTKRERAQAAFDRAEEERDRYFAIAVSLDQASLERKVKAADAAASRYRAVIAKKDPGYTVASWVRIAEIYLHFAEQIRRAAPTDELRAMALAPEQRARDALERARVHAEKHGVHGIWRERLERHLDRLPSR